MPAIEDQYAFEAIIALQQQAVSVLDLALAQEAVCQRLLASAVHVRQHAVQNADARLDSLGHEDVVDIVVLVSRLAFHRLHLNQGQVLLRDAHLEAVQTVLRSEDGHANVLLHSNQLGDHQLLAVEPGDVIYAFFIMLEFMKSVLLHVYLQ